MNHEASYVKEDNKDAVHEEHVEMDLDIHNLFEMNSCD